MRATYLAADRADLGHCVKNLAKKMQTPRECDMQRLKRLGRYLVGRPRLVFRYAFQSADTIDCYSDTDWAGCPKTRKSTSGGGILLGQHILKTYSSTQPTISLSSGEAEFYGVVNAAGAGDCHRCSSHRCSSHRCSISSSTGPQLHTLSFTLPVSWKLTR